jgi:hypothetical protein
MFCDLQMTRFKTLISITRSFTRKVLTTIHCTIYWCTHTMHELHWQHLINSPTLSSFGIWVSLNVMKCSLRGYPSKIVRTNNHFQIVIIIDIVPRQYKIQSPTWSSPSWSSRIASYEPHVTAQTFTMKTPSLFTRLHLAPCHSNLCLLTTFEFFLPIPSPYSTLSCQRPLTCLFPFSCHSKFSYTRTCSSPSTILSSLPSSLLESEPKSHA